MKIDLNDHFGMSFTCDAISAKRKFNETTQYYARYENNKWDWINEDQILNLRDLLRSYNIDSPRFDDFAIYQRLSNHQNQKNSSHLDLDFQLADSDILYALNTQNYYLTKNSFEPRHTPLPEVVKIFNMINEDGNIKWKVLIKGDDKPTVITHAELRLRNSYLLIEYFQHFLLS